MPWLPVPQNLCQCSSKIFAKCVALVVEICCVMLLVFGHLLMTFNKKTFATRNDTDAQIATEFVVGTFHKFFRKVLKYGSASNVLVTLTFGII